MGTLSRARQNDDFSASLHAIEEGPIDEAALVNLAQLYAYVFPDADALSALANLGPLVEIGAGTGYWAYRLRSLGADVIAFDIAPPDEEKPNRYHAKTPVWSSVLAGDHSVLSAFTDRALFLCWPPLFSDLGETLSYYQGDVVAIVGDGGHRTARLRGLNDLFALVSVSAVHALDPLPGEPATLSIWRRRTRG